MLIKSTGDSIAIAFASLVPMKKDEFVVKAFEKDGVKEVKVAPDGSGRQQYRSNLTVLSLDDRGNVTRQESDTTVSILSPVDVVAGVHYQASGAVWITHYVTNGNRLGVSIVVESIAPRSESKSLASAK